MYETRELELFKELHFYESQFFNIIFTVAHRKILSQNNRLQSASSTHVSVKSTLIFSSKVFLFLDVLEIEIYQFIISHTNHLQPNHLIFPNLRNLTTNTWWRLNIMKLSIKCYPSILWFLFLLYVKIFISILMQHVLKINTHFKEIFGLIKKVIVI